MAGEIQWSFKRIYSRIYRINRCGLCPTGKGKIDTDLIVLRKYGIVRNLSE